MQQQNATLEKQVKEYKNKLQQLENLAGKKDQEIEAIKGKMEKKRLEDEKYIFKCKG